MSGDALWSVKGIDPRARDAAREAARREGLSLGDWLNKVILVDGDDNPRGGDHPPYPDSHGDDGFDARPTESKAALQSLDRLAERIETAEARSALAITGIDQSVYALVSRLENAERGQKQYNSKLESGIRELRATQTAVADRLARMEQDTATSQEDLAALRRLGVALTALSTRMQQVEAAVADTAHVDAKLDAMAEQVGLASHEMQRVSARAEDAIDAAAAVKDEVSGAVKDMAERLTQAETATDAAVGSLQVTVEDLYSRLAQAEAREGDKDAALASVSQTVMRMIDAGREEMAREIASAFAALKPGETEAALVELQGRLAAAERRQLASFERIGSEIDRLAQSLDQRLRSVEDRNSTEADSGVIREEMARVVEALDRRVQAVADRDMAAIQRMGDEMSRFAGTVEERLASAEHMTADAIVQVGAQIEGVAQRLQDRQDNIIDQLMDRMREQDEAAGQRLDNAFSHVTERLDTVERATGLDSPLHKALETLSERLRVVETTAPKALPKSITGPSVGNTTAPRVSGWGMYDGTPATPAAVAAIAEAIAPKIEEPAADIVEDIAFEDVTPPPTFEAHVIDDIEELDILDFEDSPATDWDIDPALEDAPELDAAAEESDPLPSDDLAALIELLESAAAEDAAAQAADRETFGDLDVLADDAATPIPGMDFTRPEPASEILASDILAEEEPLLLSGENRIENEPDSFDRGLRDEIADLDPELAEAIFGRAGGGASVAAVEAPIVDAFDADALQLTNPVFEEIAAEAPIVSADDDDTLELNDIFESALVEDLEPTPAPHLDAVEAESQQPVDYLTQARMAALANQSSGIGKKAAPPIRGRRSTPAPTRSSGGLTRAHILTAASVAAVAAVGAGTFFARETDPQKLRENLARATPQPDAANAAMAPQVVTPPAATADAPVEFADLAPAPESATPDRFPEAQPTIAPEAKVAALTPAPETAKPAAKSGDAAKAYQRALETMREDPSSGAALMRQAADQGYAPAQYRLSKAYERGEGVAKNLSEARRWTERAARAGNRKAMHDLAVFYAEGEGGRQDYVSAVEWFRKAADFGLSDSQYNLGVLYEQGLGVTQDEGEALYWFEVAGRNGDQDAARRAREIGASAPPSIVTSSMHRADGFKARTPDVQANGEPRRAVASN